MKAQGGLAMFLAFLTMFLVLVAFYLLYAITR
jgi:hypothetical protein